VGDLIGSPLGQGAGDALEMGGDDAPADPAREACFAVVGAALQAIIALKHADPPLHPTITGRGHRDGTVDAPGRTGDPGITRAN
jgi:hypothetical protein